MDRPPLLAPELHVGTGANASPDRPHQPHLPLATEGVQRWVWQSQFGAILIEVIDDTPYVNGKAVKPMG